MMNQYKIEADFEVTYSVTEEKTKAESAWFGLPLITRRKCPRRIG